MSDNGFRESEREQSSDSSSYKVDPGIPASLAWQRKLNYTPNTPSQFALTYRDIIQMKAHFAVGMVESSSSSREIFLSGQ
ncbi:unnamed protein product [Ilex paraguariensis]|uniref:Uncharacterized protein n=1 Tax=Ilex paraguariensis TaxID=185542 RepID=A0ABC8UHG7_9AQUA